MPVEFEVSQVFPATPEAIYQAWLSSDGHTAMTGSPAKASDAVRQAVPLQNRGRSALRPYIRAEC